MRHLCLLLPLLLPALPVDSDGDGWPDIEERAKGFDPKSTASFPPAPRYAVVDLGPLSQNGMPVALSSTGQRVLTASGRRWSWQSGWQQLALPSDVEVNYDIIRSDGAVIGRMEHFDALEPYGELWFWDSHGNGRSIPGTRRDYTVTDLPGEESSWEFYPIKWLRADDFLARAIPLTIEMAPIPIDVLVASVVGAPRPVRRLSEASIAADGSGSRWVKPFLSVDGEAAEWRLEGAGSRATLCADAQPLALTEDGEMLTHYRHRLYWYASLATEPVPLSESNGVKQAALTVNDAGEVIALSLGPSSLVWDLQDITKPPSRLVNLVEAEEMWVNFASVAADNHGAILAIGSRLKSAQVKRSSDGVLLTEGWGVGDVELRIVLLIPMRVRCDLERAVDASGLRLNFPMDDSGHTPAARPIRLWLNDDHDAGDWTDDPDSDVPGLVLPTPHNALQPQVGGRSDLVDWFPVCLRLGHATQDLPPFRLRILSANLPINAVETSLPIVRATQYFQREFGWRHGPGLNQLLSESTKSMPSVGGIVLSSTFSDQLKEERLLGAGEGMFLIEGREKGDALVWIALIKANVPDSRAPLADEILLRAPLRIKIAPVEDFYRQWDARASRARLSPEPSALPDAQCPGPWVIFTHGFNVNARAGRAWGAEIFKRMYQAGSCGRFISFRWFGDQGSANYAAAVECAPAAADRLVEQSQLLELLDSKRPWVLLGHSLGAYVSVLAGRERMTGLNVQSIVLIDAALPSEALDADAPSRRADYSTGEGVLQKQLMLPLRGPWRTVAPYTWPAVQASCWAELFPMDDLRSTCRWTGRVPSGAPVLNLYSRTEDVLMPPPADAAFWPTLLTVSDYGAWVYAETTKGRWTSELVNSQHAQGGWALAQGATRRSQRLMESPLSARPLLLRTEPLFAAFRLQGALTSSATGPRSQGSRAVMRRQNATTGWGARTTVPSALTWTVRDELLAHAIPARSCPAGSVPLTGVINYRMDGVSMQDPLYEDFRPFPLGWPRGIESVEYLPAPTYVWRHSDWKNVAFPYVYPVFAFIGKTSGLTLNPSR